MTDSHKIWGKEWPQGGEFLDKRNKILGLPDKEIEWIKKTDIHSIHLT